MIIIKLLVGNREQGDLIASSLLKNRFTLNVFGNDFDSFHLNPLGHMEKNTSYVIQFLTKSMLFSEIEATLKRDFPQINFSICATPIVHMAISLHDKIRQRINGLKTGVIEAVPG